MATTTVECPECQARLKVTDIAPGKRIRCPKCKTSFTVPAEEDEEVLPTAKSLGSARKPAHPREDDEDEEIETRPARRESMRAREEDPDEEEEEDRPKRRKSKKHKKSQGNPVLLWSLVGGGAALLIGGGIFLVIILQGGKTPDAKKGSAANGRKGPDGNQPPVWAPDAQVVTQLADEVDVQGYRVKPPKGYQLKEAAGPGGAKLRAWTSSPRADGSAAQFTIAIGTPPADQLSRQTLEGWLDALLEGIQRRRQNWTRTQAEHGQVNGLAFVRARWSGTETASGKKMHGFCYALIDGQRVVGILSQDNDPGHEAPLKLAEAAALTFRKP